MIDTITVEYTGRTQQSRRGKPLSVREDKERRRNILDFISDFTEVHGYAPTFREVGMGVGLSSSSTVQYQLRVLAAMGRVTWADGVCRSLKVIEI